MITEPKLAERALVAAALADPGVINGAAVSVSVDDFSDSDLSAIWSVALGIAEDGGKSDTISVAERLAAAGVAESAAAAHRMIREIAESVPWETADADACAELVHNAGIDRRVRRHLLECSKLEGSAAEIVDRVLADLPGLLDHATEDGIMTAAEVAASTFESARIAGDAYAAKRIVGMRSFLPVLDVVSAPFDPGDMTVIAAATSRGKTATGLTIVANEARFGPEPAAMISLEDSKRIIGPRLLAPLSGVEVRKFRSGRIDSFEFERIEKAANEVSRWPFYLVDVGALDAFEVCRMMRILRERYGVRMIFVDYIQKIWTPSAGYRDRGDELAWTVTMLKKTAQRIGIHLILGSQIPKEAGTRKPRLGDSKGTGAIDDEAENWFGLWRDMNSDEERQPLEVNIGKNKNGPIKPIELMLDAPRVHVYDPSSQPTFL